MSGNHAHEGHGHDGACSMPRFNSRELIVREDILAKAKELAALISTSSEVEYFKRLEKQLAGNDHVQDLIKQIKKKQKEIVAFETTFKNKQMAQKIEAEIKVLQDELDSIPIVNEFQQAQVDINYLLQLVISAVRDTVSERIEVEQGKETGNEAVYSD